MSDPESFQEDIRGHVGRLARTDTSAGKAVDGIVMPREDLSETVGSASEAAITSASVGVGSTTGSDRNQASSQLAL